MKILRFLLIENKLTAYPTSLNEVIILIRHMSVLFNGNHVCGLMAFEPI